MIIAPLSPGQFANDLKILPVAVASCHQPSAILQLNGDSIFELPGRHFLHSLLLQLVLFILMLRFCFHLAQSLYHSLCY